MTHNVALGQKLRSIRMQKGFSLCQVEQQTGGKFKSSILGAYERGERSISISRLSVLADFYDSSVEELLAPTSERRVKTVDQRGVRIHMRSIDNLPSKQRNVVSRFVDYVRDRRGDPSTDILTIRQEDLSALACIMGVSEKTLSTTMQRRRVTS